MGIHLDKHLYRVAIVLTVIGLILLLGLVYLLGSPNGVSVSDSGFSLVYRPTVATDIMNEDGSDYSFPFESEGNWNLNWIGTGANLDKSYLGIRFSGTALPAGAKIGFAQVELQANNNQIVGVSVEAYAENNATPVTFTTTDRPSGRKLTTAKTPYANSVEWATDTYYQVDVLAPVQELVANNPGINSIVIVFKSVATDPYGRKFIFNDVTDQTHAPKLTLKYSM